MAKYATTEELFSCKCTARVARREMIKTVDIIRVNGTRQEMDTLSCPSCKELILMCELGYLI